MFRCYFLTKFGFTYNLNQFGDWAVVTGATDGIGKEYARQLASKGLNIVLISRSEAKLQNTSQEIVNDYKVKTKIITFDFTNSNGYNVIASDLENLNVGILVNNVGMVYGSLYSYDDCDLNHFCDVLRCNIFSDFRVTNIVLKNMMTNKKGVIIHISSGVIYLDAPYSNIYGPSKFFMKKFATSLQLESSGIHHQILTPMYVESKLSKRKAGIMVPTAEEYVKSALRTVGVAEVLCGYWSHELLCVAIKICPAFLVDFVYQKIRSEILRKV